MIDAWTNFGPIGVAMAIMTWCGVLGTGWVVTACVGAVLLADALVSGPAGAGCLTGSPAGRDVTAGGCVRHGAADGSRR